MKRFLGLLKKEFYHIFRDKRTLLILFGMPIAQILLFGYAVTNEIREAKVAVLDLSKDRVTTAVRDKIMSSTYYDLAANLEGYGEIESVLRSGRAKQVIVFEPGFASRLEQDGEAHIKVIADAIDPNVANTLHNYTASILRNYLQETNQPLNMPLSIVPEIEMRYNPKLKGVYLFVPGLITIILMLVSAMMTSISITREKEMGTMEVLLASPMKPIQIILGKVTPYILLSLINTIVILLAGYYVFDVPIHGSKILLILESLLFIVAALSLGIVISTVAKTQQVALMISLMGLMLPVILLSGFMFPIENMPLILQYISNIIPARWFIIIVKNIMLKGSEFAFIWKETLILVGFTVFFIGVSVKKFKIRLE